MRGKYPQILEDSHRGEEARKLLADAEAMLDRFETDESIRPRGVYGLFPAGAQGDDIIVYEDASRASKAGVFHTLRQQTRKAPGKPNRALADFVAPVGSGHEDWIGAFAVTAGPGVSALADAFEAALDDYQSILVKAVADRLAEAFAEYIHAHVRRTAWGYDPQESLDNADLIAERYRGIRPAPGYPAQPDHTEKLLLWTLLDAERHTGITLTESLAMQPAASVCGLFFAHPEADYFNLGVIGEDQLSDYAARKGLEKAEMERWLAPRLAYEPSGSDSVSISTGGAILQK
jgi:5-methyltetrahydrofolate--homocysteine methyltransferase